MQNVMTNPRLTHELVRRGIFAEDPLRLVDVGMRHGVEGFWNNFNANLDVVGFEPDQEECDRINSTSPPFRQRCFPVALDSKAQERSFFERGANNASNGFMRHNIWWTHRFGHNAASWDPLHLNLPRRESIEQETPSDVRREQVNTRTIQTSTLYEFLNEIEFECPDFLKVDTEGADFEVIQGAEKLLNPTGILGIKCEFRLIPDREGALFHEIFSYMVSKGYFLAGIEMNKSSRRAMPMPVAWNHTDQYLNPISGPTDIGQPTDGDMLFFRDLIADDYRPEKDADIRRILKTAAMLEIFGLPDCAAELLLYYKDAIASILRVEDVLDQLVPEGFPKPYPPFSEYVQEQIRTVQRYRPPAPRER